MQPLAAEVIVLGAGPAGAALAGTLARRGLDVVLVDDPRPPRAARRLETAAPSLAEALALFGLPGLLDHAALGPAQRLQRHGPWAPEPGAAGDGLLHGPLHVPLDRHRFDTALHRWALAQGARALPGRGLPAPDGLAQLRQGDGRMATAAVLVDARGRRAGSMSALAAGQRTVALMAAVLGEPPPAVEAQPEGWLWAAGAAGAGGQGVLAAFVDAASVAGVSAGARDERLRRHLRASPTLAPWANQVGATQLCDATPRQADAAPSPTRLRVGDAATALSPLASQGLVAALRSAWQAAACIHTALETPSHAALAWAFHRERQRDTAEQHRRLAEAHHAAAAAVFGTPFWQSRRAAGEPTLVTAPRAWPGLDRPLAPSPGLHCAPQPVLEHDRIVERPALVHPALAAPLVWLAGVPAVEWLAPLATRPTLAVLLDLWHERHGPERTAAAWPQLWQAGLVVEAD